MTLGLKKSALSGTIQTAGKIPANAGKLPPVTCGKSNQSLLAESLACIRMYFYLQNSLRGAIPVKFASASCTV